MRSNALSLLCLAAFLCALGLPPRAWARKHAKQPEPGVSPAPSASPAVDSTAELDHAFEEFKVAAAKLGKSMARAADENTAEARNRVMQTVSKVMHELSKSMDQATRKLEGGKKDQ